MFGRSRDRQKGGYDSAIDWVEGDLLARDSIGCSNERLPIRFHVAGDYRFWARNPREIFANNVQGTINLLETAKCCGIEKIVCTSTTGILPDGNHCRSIAD
jgi:dihydroflavonol-4-reductase